MTVAVYQGLYVIQNIRISTDILWRVFHISTEPVPCTFVFVNRRNNEARADIAMWARVSQAWIYGYFHSVDD